MAICQGVEMPIQRATVESAEDETDWNHDLSIVKSPIKIHKIQGTLW